MCFMFAYNFEPILETENIELEFPINISITNRIISVFFKNGVSKFVFMTRVGSP